MTFIEAYLLLSKSIVNGTKPKCVCSAIVRRRMTIAMTNMLDAPMPVRGRKNIKPTLNILKFHNLHSQIINDTLYIHNILFLNYFLFMIISEHEEADFN